MQNLPPKKYILITGSLGFIGSNVLTYLFEKYPTYCFIGFDANKVCSNTRNISDRIRTSKRYIEIIGDLTRKNDVAKCFQFGYVETVLHFAAESHVDTSFVNSIEFTHTNVYGTHILVEQAHINNVARFVHVSTDEVYGDVDYSHAVDENSMKCPTNPYAASKLGAEAVVQSYIRSFNFPAIITRGNNVYGKYQFCEKVIPKFIHRRLLGLPFNIHGDGNALRSYVHIDDVVQAFDIIMHQGIIGTVYNIGTDIEYSVNDVAYEIIKQIPCDTIKDPMKYVKNRCFNDKRYCIDSQRLMNLGWKPCVTLQQGLQDTINWISTIGLHWWSNNETFLAIS